jgi:Carboxypeptidase regulatory-like domain
MQLFRKLFLCVAALSAPAVVLAQGTPGNSIREDASTEAANLSLPDAPEPKLSASNIDLVDEKTVTGPSQGIAGEREEQKDSAKQSPSATESTTANIGGTVTDTNGDTVAGVTVVLETVHSKERRTTVANESGSFQFDNLKPGISYRITIAVQDFEAWNSPPIVLSPGQYLFLSDIKLKVSNSVTSVTVYATQEQIATEQVTIEEKQRVFGIIPNFYVTYDPHPVPLTTKLKFKLAYKANTDPVTFFGIAFMAAVYQAGDVPNYQQGWAGYGQRVGAGLADTTTDIFFGGAILPWLFHQDPRYFYQGTGTKKARVLHALSSPYVCRGDNGKTQPNYSSMGGDLISGAISNIYYPESNRGPGLVFEGFFITTGVRTVNAVLQEFVIRKLTPSARHQN